MYENVLPTLSTSVSSTSTSAPISNVKINNLPIIEALTNFPTVTSVSAGAIPVYYWNSSQGEDTYALPSSNVSTGKRKLNPDTNDDTRSIETFSLPSLEMNIYHFEVEICSDNDIIQIGWATQSFLPDDEEGERFEVELEIIDPQKVENNDQLYNIIHKVHNILEVL